MSVQTGAKFRRKSTLALISQKHQAGIRGRVLYVKDLKQWNDVASGKDFVPLRHGEYHSISKVIMIHWNNHHIFPKMKYD